MNATPVKIALTLTCSAFAASGSVAQDPSPEAIEKLVEMLIDADLNEDGATSRLELQQHRSQMFARLDRNEDGIISERDRPRLRIARRKFDPAFEQVLNVFDANGDERVTLAEWNRTDRDLIGMLDANGDDRVDRSELPTLP